MPLSRSSTLPIFRTAAQARLLARLFVTGETRPLSLTALSERTGIPLSTVQREIAQLEKAGLVASERVGQTRLVYADEESPYFHELQSILLKAFGPVHLLNSYLGPIHQVSSAYIYGSWARRYHGEEGVAPRDLDLVVVGRPRVNQVYAAARRAEDELGFEVNPIIATPEEWEKPKGVLKRIKTSDLVEIPLSRP